ncbi:unnamed protein product, partial [Gadus morhua 'NCC']
KCFGAHYKLPYSWEVLEGHQWTLLDSSKKIEEDYCNPKITFIMVDGGAVWFETMTRGFLKVRRLSSISSVLQPTSILTTEWLWYWEDENGNWNQYDSPTSTKLEQKFQNNPQEVVEFTAGFEAYTLSLQDMIQTNKKHGTKRLVRRRPRFRSSANVQVIRTSMVDGLAIFFETMRLGFQKVRRLASISSVLQPTFLLTTEWLWYWEDEHGNWNQFDSPGPEAYTLSLQDMIQTNKRYGTQRQVRRRLGSGPPPTCRTTGQAFPRHWDKSQVPEIGHKKVLLRDSSKEYKKVETLFRQTMTAFDIVKIERIQNKSLWDQFQLQREQMKTRNGGHSVAERKLFHGTDSKFIDPICCSNFDWRICGTHGTILGKGSYFARDASYSHTYTSYASTVRSMFVSRVLVGHHTRGSADYVRPPSKDGRDTLFYDSCVDSIRSPSIFVVFDRPQIYPEFLLTYKAKAAVVGDSLSGLLVAIAATPGGETHACGNTHTCCDTHACGETHACAQNHARAAVPWCFHVPEKRLSATYLPPPHNSPTRPPHPACEPLSPAIELLPSDPPGVQGHVQENAREGVGHGLVQCPGCRAGGEAPAPVTRATPAQRYPGASTYLKNVPLPEPYRPLTTAPPHPACEPQSPAVPRPLHILDSRSSATLLPTPNNSRPPPAYRPQTYPEFLLTYNRK